MEEFEIAWKIIMSDFVTLEIAKKLKEKGFSYGCLFVYNKEQVINPEIIKEFGELSDDGYYELTKDGGGRFDWNFVYIYETQLIQYSDVIIEKDIVRAPTISQALKWLREEMNIICLPHIDPFEEKWFFYVVKLPQATDIPEYFSTPIYNTYEEAALAGIEYVLDKLI